ncbi:MAG: peptide chain release factor N(5)-glutamine methyltransferase [Gammaproteobacteria bacterium]|nr:peptide chain release factor N(5)-glutamine methyltransferase [Gammaproteobacteria bacterium]
MAETPSVGELRAQGRRTLAGPAGGSFEADLLLSYVLNESRAWLYANDNSRVSTTDRDRYQGMLERRARGEPVAYLLGVREFWSLPFVVTPDVLIPRPETELLVAVALECLPKSSAGRIADLGTGSGIVAIALATERPACEVHATDISQAALEIARLNAHELAPGRIALHQGDWLAALDGLFDVIVSNPPYIDRQDPHLERDDCRFEPREALTPGPDGMAAIKHIAVGAVDSLRAGGCLAFEHGFEQGGASRRLLEKEGYVRIETRKDLEGHERVTLGFRPDD